MIHVAITDDHPMVISGIKNMLSQYAHIKVTGAYQNAEALMEGLKYSVPDILLLDIQMPGVTGDEAAVMVVKQYPRIRIIALTGFDTPYYVRSMMQNGCKGYLLKNTDQGSLISAIESVSRNEQYIDPALKDELFNNMLRLRKQKSSSSPSLTRREKEVLKLIVDEYTSQEIADKLFLSLRTVEKYRIQLLQKFKAKNTVGLVKMALELNMLGDAEDQK